SSPAAAAQRASGAVAPREPVAAATLPPAPTPEVTAPAPTTVPAAPPPAPAKPSSPALTFNPPAPLAPPREAEQKPPRVRRGDRVEAGPGVVARVLVEAGKPDYPSLAARLRREAKVVVRVLVDEDGRVAKAEVAIEDKTHLGFNEAALAAARKSTYRAA